MTRQHITIDDIDWAAMADDLRTEKGDDWVAKFGDRSWQAMMFAGGILAPQAALRLKFGDPPI